MQGYFHCLHLLSLRGCATIIVYRRVGHAVIEYAPHNAHAPNIPTYAEYAVHADDVHRQMYPHGQPEYVPIGYYPIPSNLC